MRSLVCAVFSALTVFSVPLVAHSQDRGRVFPADDIIEADIDISATHQTGKLMPALIKELLDSHTHRQALQLLKTQLEEYPKLTAKAKVYMARVMFQIAFLSETEQFPWLPAYFKDMYNAFPRHQKCIASSLLLSSAEAYAAIGSHAAAHEVYALHLIEMTNMGCNLAIPAHYLSYSRNMLFPFKDFEGILSYNLKAQKAADSLKRLSPDIDISDMYAVIYADLANVHFQVGNYHSAIRNWARLLTLRLEQEEANRDVIATQNNIGLSWLKLKEYDSAKVLFVNAVDLAESQQDSVWIAIAKGNLGQLYYETGKCDKALPLIQDDIELSLMFFEYGSACNAMLTAAKIWLCLGDVQAAETMLAKAKKLSDDNQEQLRSRKSQIDLALMRSQYELSLAKKDFLSAVELQSEIRKLEEAASGRDFGDRLMNMQAMHELDREIVARQMLVLELKENRLQTALMLLASAFLLLLATGTVVVLRQRLRLAKAVALQVSAEKQAEAQKALRLKEQMQAASELNRLRQEQMEEEISVKERELSATAMHIMQKSELLATIEQKLDELTKKNKDLAPVFKEVYSTVRQDSQLEADWEKFKTHFEQVNPSFFQKLSGRCPGLSLLELRICAYLYMNLDNKAIAQLLNIQPDSLRVTKHRLRKKLGVESERQLFDLMNNA